MRDRSRPGTQLPAAGHRRDIPALTGLRAVAACWVMLLHLQVFSGPYLDQLPLLRPLIGAGWTGVELFFVLSGFVITLNYVDRLGRRAAPGEVTTFLVNRFARVWPAWAVVTVIAGAWIWTVRAAGGDSDVLTPHPPADVWHLLRQLTMTQMWDYRALGGASWVPPGWSISAEWAAYLAFPLLVVLVRPLRRLPAAVLVVLALAAMAPLSVEAFVHGTPDLEQFWVTRIVCGFTAGMLTALAYRRLRSSARLESPALTAVWTCVLLVLAGASWASWAAWRQGPDSGHDYYGVIRVLFPLLVLALALTERGPSRWLASRPMVYGGKLSYCLYLVHFFVLDVTLTLWWQDPAARSVITPGLVLAVPGLVIVCLLAAAALHHGVEEPARRLLLRWSAQVRSGRPAARVAVPRHEAAAGAPAPQPVRVIPPRTVDQAERPDRAAPEPTGPGAALAGNVGPAA